MIDNISRRNEGEGRKKLPGIFTAGNAGTLKDVKALN